MRIAHSVALRGLLLTAIASLVACSGSTTTPNGEVSPSAPSVTSISPSSLVEGSDATQVTVRGLNFVDGAMVTFTSPSGVRSPVTTQVNSSSRAVAQFSGANTPGQWLVDVTNPDNQRSNTATLTVTALPIGAPRISSISPDPVPASLEAQTITVNGSNFVPGMSASLVDANGDVFDEFEAPNVLNSGQFTMQVNRTPLQGEWAMTVTTLGNVTSPSFNFDVSVERVVTKIQPGPNATADMLAAVTSAKPGDTIEFDCGFFDLEATVILTDVEDVHIRGCGMDQTVLSFRNNEQSPEGVLISNSRGIVIEDLTVIDSAGNGFELRSVDHGTLRRVKAFWTSNGGATAPEGEATTADNYQDGRLDVACTVPPRLNPTAAENANNPQSQSPDYTPSVSAGRYGIYPVKSQNILVDDTVSIGASDAGIYVGQTNTAIISNSIARYNVFGFEIENVQGGEYFGNLAECNTAAFLVYDLDGITQYGERTRVYNNIARNNNTYNFAEPGSIVSDVPPGTGFLTLAYDRLDVFNNEFSNHDFVGVLQVSYNIFPEGDRPGDLKLDNFTEGLRIFNNTFSNNGSNPPEPTSEDVQNEAIARFLPAIAAAKIQAACQQEAPGTAGGACPDDETGDYRGAHIIWDGLVDTYDPDCPFPVDDDGNAVPRTSQGKPIHTDEHPNPPCHYNEYKFDTTQEGNPLIVPDWFYMCIDVDNTYSDDSVVFANINGTKGLDAAIAIASQQPPTLQQLQELEDFPADLDISPHRCVERFGSNLEPLPPVVIPPYIRNIAVDPEPTEEEVAELCNASVADGEVNFGAVGVNCPDLASYNLFADPEDPTSTPNGGGYPFALNTKLFSDYSVKYRVAYLPPGESATYQDSDNGRNPNATINYPVGTIIAKTFSFTDGDVETPMETRLLIKRNATPEARWEGLPYIWSTSTEGMRVATLTPGGAINLEATWDYTDPESAVLHTGSTDAYSVPNRNQCSRCHANTDADAGAAPIGPKIRNLNRVYRSESPIETDQSLHPIAGQNQIAWLCSNGFLAGCPDNLVVDPGTGFANVERSPKFNQVGDGHPTDTAADIEARARAWLEINCQHCHNSRGDAANTGFYVDVFRPVDLNFGICKGPTAAGSEGRGEGNTHDIVPANADASVLEYRIGPDAQSAAARMPPVARSVVDEEAHALITQWIDSVITVDPDKYPNSDRCN